MENCNKICMGFNGDHASCAICSVPYAKTVDGVIDNIYSSQTRGGDFPTYTRDELATWLIDNVEFRKAFLYWSCGGHRLSGTPLARKVGIGGRWSLENIVVSARNNTKSSLSKRVESTDRDGTIAEYDSIGAGARATGADRPEVSKCCSGQAKTAAGYTWRYL